MFAGFWYVAAFVHVGVGNATEEDADEEELNTSVSDTEKRRGFVREPTLSWRNLSW